MLNFFLGFELGDAISKEDATPVCCFGSGIIEAAAKGDTMLTCGIGFGEAGDETICDGPRA